MIHYEDIAEEYEKYYYYGPEEAYTKRFGRIAEIVDRASAVRPKTMIDLCGATGIFTPFLTDALKLDRAIVADNSDAMLRVAATRGFQAVKCDFNSLSCIKELPEQIGGTVGGIFIHGSIHHCSDIVATINNLGHVIDATGVIVVVASRQSRYPGPARVMAEHNQQCRQNILDLDRVPEGGFLSMHKEWFETRQPFSVTTWEYEEYVHGNFLSWLGGATELETNEFLDGLRLNDAVEIDNNDFVYVYQKVL